MPPPDLSAPPPVRPKYAFQCRACGAVEPKEAAGENATPGACHVCGSGIRFDTGPRGTSFNRIPEPENWIVLADLSPEDLKADFQRHGLSTDQVERHTPKTGAAPAAGAQISVHGAETVGSADRVH